MKHWLALLSSCSPPNADWQLKELFFSCWRQLQLRVFSCWQTAAGGDRFLATEGAGGSSLFFDALSILGGGFLCPVDSV